MQRKFEKEQLERLKELDRISITRKYIGIWTENRLGNNRLTISISNAIFIYSFEVGCESERMYYL